MLTLYFELLSTVVKSYDDENCVSMPHSMTIRFHFNCNEQVELQFLHFLCHISAQCLALSRVELQRVECSRSAIYINQACFLCSGVAQPECPLDK